MMQRKRLLCALGLLSLSLAAAPALSGGCQSMLRGTYTVTANGYDTPPEEGDSVGVSYGVVFSGLMAFDGRGNVRARATFESTDRSPHTFSEIGTYTQNGCTADITLGEEGPPATWTAYINPMKQSFVYVVSYPEGFIPSRFTANGVAEKASWQDIIPDIPD